nr:MULTISPECIES: single-stranded DNA-binding protein [unclassified Ruminococcus]
MNKVILMGRLTTDPELKTTPNGTSVTSFSLAVDRNYVKQGEERKTDFINIVAWRQRAEFICKYFTKGQLIALEGSIETRSYVDKNGNNRTAFEVVVDNAYFTGDKRNSQQGGYQQYQPAYQNSYQQSAPAPIPQAPASAYSSGSAGDFEDMPLDEDLPF